MGEGLEFPTSVTTLHILKWDLLIILQSVCAGHLYFVYSYSHGALVTFFLSLLFLPYFTIFKTSVHVTNYRPVNRNTDLLQNLSMGQPVQIGPNESFV